MNLFFCKKIKYNDIILKVKYMNKKKLIIILLILLVISIILIIEYNKDEQKKETKTNYTEQEKLFIGLGYKNEELEYINKLSENNVKKLGNKNYLDLENYYTIKNFNVDNYERYETYKNNNKIAYEKAVTMVNIGLDNEFYTNTSPAPHQDELTVLVNKYYYLEEDYVPKNLVTLFDTNRGAKMVEVAANRYKDLILAAKDDNITLESTTAYRSYSFQNTLYTNYVKEDGKEKADTYSARPGHSEHQTGLAVDLNDPNVEGKRLDDKDYEWLLENAHKYGFIVRYQESYIPITGYMEETWHIRYVGSDIATKIHELDITYEEYYDLYIAEY